ncbi:unnamed protein product [Vitrella brassicaformis CCMP3155]|uniref:Uncharacterized protein n=1 Tax=Vitrella brassicaformis (strain CCMP3155) TaxID=1169540 RepID=A0A0G4FG52_VITBC|nr:unnamed protein product [Vitrella brassicaformis CCMP3155]|eukprot:CEM12043.1 unnamed protein product [Vitrella brassicaformis CCMP3155]
MWSGRPDTDMAAAGPADGGDGDEGQRGGGDERRPVDVEERQEGRANGGAVSNVVMRQRNNASMTEPSQMPSPAIHLTARVAGGPQAAAASAPSAVEQESSSSYAGVGVVKRAGSPLEHQEHERPKGDRQRDQPAANLPSAQQPQRPPAANPPAASLGVPPSTGPTLSGHGRRPPQPPRLGGGVSSGVGAEAGVAASGGQQGSGQDRQNGGPTLPPGWKSLEKGVIDVDFPRSTSDASIRLSKAIIRRTITGAQHLTGIIHQQGSDPDLRAGLWVAGTTSCWTYPLLSLCIDNLTNNSVPSIWAADVNGGYTPVALPLWETPGLQFAVMKALIESGADINAGHTCWPIRVAIASCNRPAFGLLMSRPGIQLQGRQVMRLPSRSPTDQPTAAHEAILLSFYRQLIQRHPTLAAETDADKGSNSVHWAAMKPSVWSQQFIEDYIDMLVANGADITAVDNFGLTPLHLAVISGAHCVAASLFRRLTPADINRGRPNDPTCTPLTDAARWLDESTQRLRDDNVGEETKDESRRQIPNLQKTIRTLLQAGADIALMPTATERHRRRRQLVLAERTALPNELPIPEPRPATIEAPFQPPTAKHKTTEQPSADRLLLSNPSCVSTADQTPREEPLPGPSAGSKLGRGRGLGLPAAAPSLSSRAAPSATPLPSAEELHKSAMRRPFVSSSPSHPPPRPSRLPPAHRPASGADESFPHPAHEPQHPDGSFLSSSSGHRPSGHRGPLALVKCPRSFGASLSHDDARQSPFYGPRSGFHACTSSSSYDHSSAPPAPAAAAFATPSAPYEEPLGSSHHHEGGQGVSVSVHHGAAAPANALNDRMAGSSREAELQRENEELKRRLAELTIAAQQHQPSSSSSSSAPLPLQPSPSSSSPRVRPSQREMGCYDHRCSKWRRDLHQVRAENARRRQENERIKRQNEGRRKEKRIPLVELLDDPEYLCEHCKKRVEFAGSRDEVRQWADQPIM